MLKVLSWVAFGATILLLGTGWPDETDGRAGGAGPGGVATATIEPQAAGGALGLFAGAFPLIWAGQKIDAVIGATQKAGDDPLYTSSVRGSEPYRAEGSDLVVDPAHDMILKSDPIAD